MSDPLNNQYMTVKEYLEFEQRASVRHELVGGQLFAITGTTAAHNIICGNLYSALFGFLGGSGCKVYIIDIKLKVRVQECDNFYYPDVMVTCEPFDGKSVYQTSPRLIVEVLSPSTKHIDRRDKLMAYKHLPSLVQYVVVYQNRARIECHTKSGDRWELVTLSRSDDLILQALPKKALTVSVESVYSGVMIPSVVEESEEEYETSSLN